MNNGSLLAIMTIGAVLSAIIASGKGRSPLGWFVLGGLFPLIAMIAILCLPAVVTPAAAVPTGSSTP